MPRLASFTSLLAILLLSSSPSSTLVSGAPATPGVDDNGVYELRIFAPDIPDLHNQKVHASNSNFFIGLPGPSTYCPRMMESSCPDNPDTLVYGQMRAMAAMTPGGQAIIVLPDGQVSYTAAHSGAVPPGSLGGGGAAAGWVNATLVSDCEPGEGVEVVTWREPGTFRRLLKEREMGAENGDDDDEDHDDYDKHDEGHDGEDYKENESDDDDSRSPYENSTVHGQPKRPSKTAIPSSHKLRKRGGAGGIFVCSGDWMSDSAASKGATGAMYAGRDGFDGADDDRCRLIEGLVQAWTNRPYGAYQYL